MFIKMIKSRRKEWLLILCISLAVLGFSTLLEFFMSFDTDKYVGASTMFFYGIVCAVLIFLNLSDNITRLFNMSISMGGTRKWFIVSMFILSIIKYTTVLLLGFVNHKIERLVLPGKEIFNLDYLFKPDICIILAVMLASIEILMGSMVMRFGVKCYWVLWGINMIIYMLPASISKAMEREGDSMLKSFGVWIIDVITNFTRMQVISIGFAAAAILIGTSSWIIMTQDVTA